MTLIVKALSLGIAKKIADAAESKAQENNLKIIISIMDNHVNLKYFRRMDGNNLVSVKMAQLKALTSARIPTSTQHLAKRNEGLPKIQKNTYFLTHSQASSALEVEKHRASVLKKGRNTFTNL